MKIYNRRGFAAGLFMITLGVINLAADFWRGDFGLRDGILAAALFFFGGGLILRSFSRAYSREDKLAALDERNRLIQLKSRGAALRATRYGGFLLMLLLLVAGKLTGEELFIAIAVGLAFALSISLLAELIATFYYESKN